MRGAEVRVRSGVAWRVCARDGGERSLRARWRVGAGSTRQWVTHIVDIFEEEEEEANGCAAPIEDEKVKHGISLCVVKDAVGDCSNDAGVGRWRRRSGAQIVSDAKLGEDKCLDVAIAAGGRRAWQQVSATVGK